MRLSDVTKNLSEYYDAWKQLTRGFPYLEFLFIMIPFFSLLFVDRIVTSVVLAIFLMIPFVFLHASGFIYNNLCDMQVDSPKKNPIKRGAISRNMAYVVLLIFLICAFVSFIFVYNCLLATFLFVLQIFLWFSYSGLKIRFKERSVGVFVASFVGWTAAPLILLVQFYYFSNIALSLLVFVFLTYSGREILHTVLEYESDLKEKCQTFAVRVGKIKGTVVEQVLLTLGVLSIFFFSIFSNQFILVELSLFYVISYSVILLIQILSYELHRNLEFLWYFGRWPFFLSKLYLVIITLVFLGLSPVSALLVLVFFFAPKRY